MLLVMLELFAEVNDVFTENDALSAEKRQMGMGRLYRAWKRACKQIDPEFDSSRYRGH